MLEGYAQDADAFTTTAKERASEPMDWWLKRICDTSGLSQAFGAFHNDSLVGMFIDSWYVTLESANGDFPRE